MVRMKHRFLLVKISFDSPLPPSSSSVTILYSANASHLASKSDKSSLLQDNKAIAQSSPSSTSSKRKHPSSSSSSLTPTDIFHALRTHLTHLHGSTASLLLPSLQIKHYESSHDLNLILIRTSRESASKVMAAVTLCKEVKGVKCRMTVAGVASTVRTVKGVVFKRVKEGTGIGIGRGGGEVDEKEGGEIVRRIVKSVGYE